MSLKIHIDLNQSQIKALCEKKFHQTCLPVSTLSNMVFIPSLCALCALSFRHTQQHYTQRIKLLSGCRPTVHSVSCGWVFVCCTVQLVFDAFNILAEAEKKKYSSELEPRGQSVCNMLSNWAPEQRDQEVPLPRSDRDRWGRWTGRVNESLVETRAEWVSNPLSLSWKQNLMNVSACSFICPFCWRTICCPPLREHRQEMVLYKTKSFNLWSPGTKQSRNSLLDCFFFLNKHFSKGLESQAAATKWVKTPLRGLDPAFSSFCRCLAWFNQWPFTQ